MRHVAVQISGMNFQTRSGFDILLLLRTYFLLYPAREGFFGGAVAAGVPVPDFPCFVSGGSFLAE